MGDLGKVDTLTGFDVVRDLNSFDVVRDLNSFDAVRDLIGSDAVRELIGSDAVRDLIGSDAARAELNRTAETGAAALRLSVGLALEAVEWAFAVLNAKSRPPSGVLHLTMRRLGLRFEYF
jgi:hypothetical protein